MKWKGGQICNLWENFLFSVYLINKIFSKYKVELRIFMTRLWILYSKLFQVLNIVKSVIVWIFYSLNFQLMNWKICSLFMTKMYKYVYLQIRKMSIVSFVQIPFDLYKHAWIFFHSKFLHWKKRFRRIINIMKYKIANNREKNFARFVIHWSFIINGISFKFLH